MPTWPFLNTHSTAVTDQELVEIERTLIDVIRASAEITLKHFRTSLSVDNKLDMGFDPVTIAEAPTASAPFARNVRRGTRVSVGRQRPVLGSRPNRWHALVYLRCAVVGNIDGAERRSAADSGCHVPTLE